MECAYYFDFWSAVSSVPPLFDLGKLVAEIQNWFARFARSAVGCQSFCGFGSWSFFRTTPYYSYDRRDNQTDHEQDPKIRKQSVHGGLGGLVDE